MIHDLITFLNLKSLFFKVVEDSDTSPTPLESPQSEFGRKSYDRNTVVYLFLRESGLRECCRLVPLESVTLLVRRVPVYTNVVDRFAPQNSRKIVFFDVVMRGILVIS